MAEPDSPDTGGRRGDVRRSRRPRVVLLVVAIVLGLGGGGLIWAGFTRDPAPEQVASAGVIPTSAPMTPTPAPTAPPPVSTTADMPPTRAAVPMSRSLPVSVRVPSIGVDSTLLSLGLNPDRTVEEPKDYSKAGWFDYGPTPGEAGASVILGHIDSFRGPAVFYRLRTLNPGERIEVTRADGTTANFTVDARRQYPKAQFPAQDVYGAVDYAGLRLVTCGGEFDSKARSYLDNIVVYAHLTTTT